MNRQQLIDSINEKIRQNGRGEITGEILNSVLKDMVNFSMELNPKWGGVICLELGNEKPVNFEEIYNALDKAYTEGKFLTILIYDTVSQSYFGDCDTFWKSSNGYYGIRQFGLVTTTTMNVREYRFYDNGGYERKVTSLGGE